jgi:hypothetical protein
MSRPFYSVLSILIEFGFVVFGLILVLVLKIILRLKRIYVTGIKENDKLKAFYALACAVTISHIFIIGFFENYLEVAHAVLAGILLLKYFYLQLKNEHSFS